jgi:hypothetical protein
MDGKSAHHLAERLAQKNGPEPTPPIRGRDASEVAPIFRWFALQPPPPAKPA